MNKIDLVVPLSLGLSGLALNILLIFAPPNRAEVFNLVGESTKTLLTGAIAIYGVNFRKE